LRREHGWFPSVSFEVVPEDGKRKATGVLVDVSTGAAGVLATKLRDDHGDNPG
jgi:hypothetical protein